MNAKASRTQPDVGQDEVELAVEKAMPFVIEWDEPVTVFLREAEVPGFREKVIIHEIEAGFLDDDERMAAGWPLVTVVPPAWGWSR